MWSDRVADQRARLPPMQKPTVPVPEPVVSPRPARYAAAPAMSRAAWSMARPISSFTASSGSRATRPWYRSGASATKPSAANRSATSVMCPTSPQYSWITTTPGPDPESGTARYPSAVPPLLGNVTRMDPNLTSQRQGDSVQDVVFAGEHLGGAELCHQRAQHQRAGRQHVHPAGVDHRPGGPLGVRAGQQLRGDLGDGGVRHH